MFKKLFKSRTTQNVAVAGGSVAAVMAAIRAIWPDLLPWGQDADVAIAAALTAICGRVLAFLRNPEKKGADLKGMTPPQD